MQLILRGGYVLINSHHYNKEKDSLQTLHLLITISLTISYKVLWYYPTHYSWQKLLYFSHTENVPTILINIVVT